jgi:multimeric flavodoxin WrbA
MRFLQQATLYEAPTMTFALSELNYSGCRNLFQCKKGLDHCGQSDDLTQILAAVSKAQVLVLATPVYFTNISGQLKLAIDRFFSFFVPDYPTAETKSRLSSGRHLVFLQSQGEPEDRYAGLMESLSASFRGLGFDHHHLVRACGVRNPGDIDHSSTVLQDCDAVGKLIYSRS